MRDGKLSDDELKDPLFTGIVEAKPSQIKQIVGKLVDVVLFLLFFFFLFFSLVATAASMDKEGGCGKELFMLFPP